VGTFEEFSRQFVESVGESIRLAGDVGDVVDYLIAHVLAPHVDEIEKQEGTIRIDPLLLRAKEEVEKQRRAASSSQREDQRHEH